VSQDTTGRVWDVATGSELTRLTGHAGTVRGLAVLPDGRRAVTASLDGTVRLWDLGAGHEVGRFNGHVGPVLCVACDADGRHLLTGGADKTVRLWDVETRAELKRFTRHEDTVTGVTFLADGRRSVAASEDKTVRVWNYHTGRDGRFLNLMAGVRRLCAAPDGRGVFITSAKVVRRWQPGEAPLMLELGEPTEGVAGLPDGRVLIACHDGTVRLWDVEQNRELHSFKGHGRSVLAVAAAPDATHFASGEQDGTARLWRLP
jgi:WD40 repeat protein